MSLNFADKPVIACVHLLPTPGSPRYDGCVERIYAKAVAEAKLFLAHGVDALLVENFRDGPFFPESVPPETTATIAAVTREIVALSSVPVGVAVLRNDGAAAVAIATATQARFVRVNVHVGAALAAQGPLYGKSYETMRLRNALRSDVAIFADAAVKHSKAWAYGAISEEVHDLASCSDAVIVSGALTGLATERGDLLKAKSAGGRVLIGSGATPTNLHQVFDIADGFIVGSYFKRDGVAGNEVDADRVRAFMQRVHELRRAEPGRQLEQHA